MKTVSDNEIIETSRGKKRIGALFDENAMLHAINGDLLAALDALLHQVEYMGAYDDHIDIIAARAAIAKARRE